MQHIHISADHRLFNLKLGEVWQHRGMVVPHTAAVLLIPLLLLQLGMLEMGIIIASMTTKYRNLQVLVSFGVSLWMYATPVVYPLSTVSGPLRSLLLINPVTAPMELFRYAALGVGTLSLAALGYSLLFTAAVTAFGIVIFKRTERTFMDTV